MGVLGAPTACVDPFRGDGLPADRKPFKLVVIKGGKMSKLRC
jgi:hypothetical protein